MNELEKILEEIKEAAIFMQTMSGYGAMCVSTGAVERIIRKHMSGKDADVSTNDLISRQALLDDFRHTITENSDTFDWLNMIARQPAVKKDDDWIPVEDGLPENEGVYDVTVIDGTGKKCLVTWQFLSGTYLDNSQTYVDGKHYWASSYNGEPVNKYLSKRVIIFTGISLAFHGGIQFLAYWLAPTVFSIFNPQSFIYYILP